MEFIIAATLLALLAQSYRIVDLLDEIREVTHERKSSDEADCIHSEG